MLRARRRGGDRGVVSLFELDPRFGDDVPPASHFRRNIAAELLRRGGEGLGPEIGEARAYRRIGDRGGYFPVQALDRRPRKAARAEEAEPGGGFPALQPSLGGS